MVLQALARQHGWSFKQHRARAQLAEGRLGVLPGGAPGPKVLAAVPSTYMNLSGGPVGGLASFFKVPAERIVVVHDELDIPFGQLRLKQGGGEGGHNGLKDISRALGTRDYLRVRVGIGRPPGRMDPADYVLRDFGVAERRELDLLLGEAGDAVELLLTDGLAQAQQRIHSR